MYIARRIVRAASVDVGLADPFALVQALNAQRAYQFLGSPEGDLALAQAVVYIALAPKSNSLYTAYKAARDAARRTGAVPVPFHLRNAPTSLMKRLGYARDYQYPHDSPEGWVPERYLPEPLGNQVFYTPKSWGWEGKWRELLEKRRRVVRGGGNRQQTARDHIEDQPAES
jgi:putative ATPase